MATSSDVELVILDQVQLWRVRPTSLASSDVAGAGEAHVVLDKLQLSLRSGERLGLVGANGAGKSSLLELILGNLDASEGHIWRAPGLSLVGLVELDQQLQRVQAARPAQDHQPITVQHVAQTALADIDALEASLRQAERTVSSLATQPAQQPVQQQAQLARALQSYALLREQFEQAGGYTAAQRLEAHLSRFGLVSDQAVQTLSSGERARLALAMTLSRPADVLLLDEPERHLDITQRRYLADRLSQHPAALLLSSHDRSLLDKVCSHIVYLQQGQLRRYRGNYSAFLRQHDSDQTRLLRATKLRRRERTGLEQALRKAPNVSARRRAQRRLARLLSAEQDQHLTPLEADSQYGQQLELQLGRQDGPQLPVGTALVRVQHLTVGLLNDPVLDDPVLNDTMLNDPVLNDPVLNDLSFQLEAGVTVGLVGANGTGKTTLLEALVGKLESEHPQARSFWAASAKLAYFDSQQAGLAADLTLLEQLTRYVSGLRARALLGLVGLAEQANALPWTLSLGQRARAGLAVIMATEANVILLDEPSEYLDIDMVNVLEQAILDSSAAILMVSHDAALIEAVSDRVWLLEDGQLQVYPSLNAVYTGHAQPHLPDEVAAQPPASAAVPTDDHESSLERDLMALDEHLLDPTRLSTRDYQRLHNKHAELVNALSWCYEQRQPPPRASYLTREQGFWVTLDPCPLDASMLVPRPFDPHPLDARSLDPHPDLTEAAQVWCASSNWDFTGRVYLQGGIAHLNLDQPKEQCLLDWALQPSLWALIRLLFEHLSMRAVQTQSARVLAGLQKAGYGWWVLDRAHFEQLEGYAKQQ
ncbi:MAG: ABC-F family ATP-binding cassette domain-containing protein [Deinococcota bacterium]